MSIVTDEVVQAAIDALPLAGGQSVPARHMRAAIEAALLAMGINSTKAQARDHRFEAGNTQKQDRLDEAFTEAQAIFDGLGITERPDVVALLDKLGGR